MADDRTLVTMDGGAGIAYENQRLLDLFRSLMDEPGWLERYDADTLIAVGERLFGEAVKP